MYQVTSIQQVLARLCTILTNNLLKGTHIDYKFQITISFKINAV